MASLGMVDWSGNSAKSVFEDNPTQYGISRNARFVAKVDTRDAHLLGVRE